MKQIYPDYFDQSDSIRSLMSEESNTLLIPPKFGKEQASDYDESKFDSDTTYIGLFSSGSTGTPKTIFNDRNHLIENARASIQPFNISSDKSALILASPWHVAGLTWAMACEQQNCRYQLYPPYIEKLETFISIIHTQRPDILFTVPSVLNHLLEQTTWFVPHIVVGGASIEPEMYKKLSHVTHHIDQAYGQSESGGLISTRRLNPLNARQHIDYRNVGTPADGVSISCEGKSPGQTAPIYLTSRYSIHNDRYDSGDIGYIDEKGDLFITGRSEHNDGGNCNALSGMTMVLHK